LSSFAQVTTAINLVAINDAASFSSVDQKIPDLLNKTSPGASLAQVMLNSGTILETVFPIFDNFWALAVETLHD